MAEQEAGVDGPVVQVVGTELMSLHDRALRDAGKSLLSDTLSVGRDFCKQMITLSTGAIPIYLALLKFVLPAKYKLSQCQVVTVVSAGVLFLLSTLIFAWALYPKTEQFSLDMLDEVHNAREAMIRRRSEGNFWGCLVFAGGTLAAIGALVSVLPMK